MEPEDTLRRIKFRLYDQKKLFNNKSSRKDSDKPVQKCHLPAKILQTLNMSTGIYDEYIR